MDRREAIKVAAAAPLAMLGISGVTEAHEHPIFNPDFISQILQNPGCKTEWDFALSLGDTIKEKYQSVAAHMLVLQHVTHIKTKKLFPNCYSPKFWMLTSPEVSSIFETACQGFEPITEKQFHELEHLRTRPCGKILFHHEADPVALYKSFDIKQKNIIIIGCDPETDYPNKIQHPTTYGVMEIHNLIV